MGKLELQPIGVFDSGVGGISVLADLIHLLPSENYIYYGDSGNAPYGIKEADEVRGRSLEIADFLIKQGIKALVVACNTATSVAVNELRQKLEIPVIGMEPALKPAVEGTKGGTIAVMATPMTLKEKKFDCLIRQFEGREILKLPCPGLVEIIETKGTSSQELEDYLRELFSSIDLEKIEAIVLGCTHYVFIKEALTRIVGEEINLIDGNLGTARHLSRVLQETNLVNNRDEDTPTSIIMYNTSPAADVLELGKSLLLKRLEALSFKGEVVFYDPSEIAFKQHSNIQLI
ncbi:glutamate racemase [Alkaliphilus transvaalensis]|uniref:glutamate racemase n=1 Tax=Alkaliphilus transvaalensis TaxID=114628 RepID=UPI0006880EB1|nr:glutamate racemase [Alkaliphilus transvaalensis]